MGIDTRNAEGYYDPTAHHALTSVQREERRLKRYKKLIFVSSPFAGDVKRNTESALKYSRIVVDKGAIPIAPHLLFPRFLNDSDPAERDMGITFSLRLLSKCDEMWVFGVTISQGMRRELEAARKRRMKIRFFDENGREV